MVRVTTGCPSLGPGVGWDSRSGRQAASKSDALPRGPAAPHPHACPREMQVYAAQEKGTEMSTCVIQQYPETKQAQRPLNSRMKETWGICAVARAANGHFPMPHGRISGTERTQKARHKRAPDRRNAGSLSSHSGATHTCSESCGEGPSRQGQPPGVGGSTSPLGSLNRLCPPWEKAASHILRICTCFQENKFNST